MNSLSLNKLQEHFKASSIHIPLFNQLVFKAGDILFKARQIKLSMQSFWDKDLVMHTYLWSSLPDLFYSKAPVGRYRNENDDKYSIAAGPKGTAIIILIFIGLSFKHLHLAFRRAFFLPDEGHLKHILTSSD